jgi:hypothetical protein
MNKLQQQSIRDARQILGPLRELPDLVERSLDVFLGLRMPQVVGIPLRELDGFPFIAFVRKFIPGFYGVEPVFIIVNLDMPGRVERRVVAPVFRLQLPPPRIFAFVLTVRSTQNKIVTEQLQSCLLNLGKMMKVLAFDLGVFEEGR